MEEGKQSAEAGRGHSYGQWMRFLQKDLDDVLGRTEVAQYKCPAINIKGLFLY